MIVEQKILIFETGLRRLSGFISYKHKIGLLINNKIQTATKRLLPKKCF